MSIIDDALTANRDYAKRHDPRMGQRPAPKIAVVACMDPRLSNLPEILGLPHAHIDIIRTGGPAVTEDVLGELVVSNRVLGTTEIMPLNHTGCGFTTFSDDELNARMSAATVTRPLLPCASSLRGTPAHRSRSSGHIPGSHEAFRSGVLSWIWRWGF
jgi:carbonic anhydrase